MIHHLRRLFARKSKRAPIDIDAANSRWRTLQTVAASGLKGSVKARERLQAGTVNGLRAAVQSDGGRSL